MKAKSAATTKKSMENSKVKKDKPQNSKSAKIERTRSDDERLLLDKVRVAIASELDLSTTLRTIVESVAETFGYSHVSLYLLKDETLVLQHQVGYPQVIHEISITQGVSGRVARSGQPAFIRDAQDDPAFLNAIDGLTSEICVPIFDEGKVAGTLNIESLQTDSLTDSDLKLMIALSESISPAIGRARLYTELRESEERFRLASWATKDALWDWNIKANQIQWDAGLQKVFHYPPETTHTHIEWRRDHIHPQDREKVDLTMNQALKGNMEFWSKEYRFRRQDGTYANVMDRAYILREDNGQPYRMIGAMMDITERKQAEQALRRSENEYRSLFENVPDGIYRTTPDGRILSANPALVRMFGYETEKEFKRAGIADDLYLNLGDREHAMRMLERDGEIHNFELTLKRRDGSLLILLENARAIKDDEGRVRYYEGVLTDITERKQAETERQMLINIMQGSISTENLQEYLGFVHHAIAKVIFAENFFVLLKNNDTGLFEEIYSVDKYDPPAPPAQLEKSIAAYVFRTSEPLLLTQQRFDEMSARDEVELVGANSPSWMGVPLRTARETIGVMVVQDYEMDNRYSESDKEFFASIGGQVAQIVEHKQAEEAERDQRTLAEALRDAAKTLNQSLDLRSVFDQILNIVGRVVPHDAATVMLIEDGKLHLGRSKGYKERGLSPENILNALDLQDEGNLKKMYESRQPELIPDISAYPNWKQFPGIDWLRSNVGAPMIIQDSVIGFLLLDSGTPGFFTHLHAQRLQAFANQAAIAVQNARLYEAAHAEIRERKQAEDALIQFRNVMDSSNDAIYMIDVETGRYVDFNYSAYELLEYTREELLQKTIMDVAGHIPNIDVWRERVDLVLENDRLLLETMYRRKSGSSFPVEVSAKMLTMEGKPILLATVRDITERKEAQKHINRQLEELTALHRVALAGIQAPSVDELIELVTQIIGDTFFPDHFGVILLDEDKNMLRPHSSYRGLPAMKARASFPLTMGIAGKVASSGQPQRIGDIRLDPDYFQASSESVSELCVPIHLGGRVIGVINAESRQLDFFTEADERLLVTIAGQTAIAIDHANLLKRLQLSNVELEKRVRERTEELNQTNIELRHANRTKDEFLANMSHELRTPLNSILGFSETLLEQRRGPINQKQEQYVNLIYSSGQHLLGLINDILEVSKIEAGKLELRPDTIFVSEVCESSLNFIKEMAAKKSITVEFKNEDFISTLHADPQRLKQILVNLLSNAVKFTPENGKVSLEVRVNNERDQIQFSVTDNGIGIANENLSKLFIPFSQIDSSLSRQYEGTGLGLALVLKLTEMQGGSVKVKSEPGTGSRFTIKLPWSENKGMKKKDDSELSTPIEAVEKTGPMNRELVKILLAEDNLSNVLTIQEYLSDHGYEVVVAHNGVEAIKLAEKTSPNIILMDIQMPEMDGLEAIRRLRAKPEFVSVPIIALTALAMPGDRERCLEAGASEYLSKPVSLKGLVKTIRDMLIKS